MSLHLKLFIGSLILGVMHEYYLGDIPIEMIICITLAIIIGSSAMAIAFKYL